uniref:Uncharacterized protein n=1 Tax=viral metagenome TaxID=1070528 RepID=A0A6C0H8K0_9ZZZZ
MNLNIFIAILTGLINALLSLIIPCLFKNSKNTFINEFKIVYQNNKQMIIVSSIIVMITVYIALITSPDITEYISQLTGMEFTSSSEYKPMGPDNINFILKVQPSTNETYNMSRSFDPVLYQLMEEIDTGTSNNYRKNY